MYHRLISMPSEHVMPLGFQPLGLGRELRSFWRRPHMMQKDNKKGINSHFFLFNKYFMAKSCKFMRFRQVWISISLALPHWNHMKPYYVRIALQPQGIHHRRATVLKPTKRIAWTKTAPRYQWIHGIFSRQSRKKRSGKEANMCKSPDWILFPRPKNTWRCAICCYRKLSNWMVHYNSKYVCRINIVGGIYPLFDEPIYIQSSSCFTLSKLHEM